MNRKDMTDKIYNWIAWHLPQRVIYHAFFRFWSHATTYEEGQKMNPDEMNWILAINLWERKYGKYESHSH